ncbi:MAG: PEP-CTERM sorting domain-containing protein, partial [Planctomycetes bacterium]|nr:PEP-CTERM sorting domain-containing protein [Planctomycetota bacterium]
VGNGGSLTVNGPSILNQGIIQIAYGGMAGGGTLAVTNGTVTGGGAIQFVSAGTLSGALTLESGNLIHGSGGHLTAWLVNRGTVNADVNNSWLSLETGAKTNEGVFSASGGGRLEVRTSINQTDLGRIVAGDSSTVQYYNGSSLSGGTTESSGTGKHFITGQNVTTTLTDITNTGHWLVQDGSIVNLTGSTFTNNGTFEIGGYTGGSGWGTMRLDSNVMLAGSGELLLAPGIVDSPSGFTLTNSATHTIHGRGNLQAAIANQGQVIADYSGGTLSLENAPKSNEAMIKATGGGILAVKTAITQSASGQIAAEDNSRVQYFSGAAVSGGTTASSGTGKHFITGQNVTTTLTDITNTGHWLAENGSYAHLAGSTFTNEGTFEIGGYTGGSGWGTMRLDSSVMLAGSGDLLLAPGIVDSPSGFTLTNSATHTIHGHGKLQAAIDNQGQVIADYSGGTLSLENAPKSNQATMKATGGATLAVKTAITQSASGQIAAEDNSRVQYFSGAAVSGGTTASSGSGFHLVSGGGVSITLNDVTNTGNWLAENGSIVNLAGSTFTNDGTFEIGGYTGGSGRATLMPADGMTLQGSGTLLLTPGYVNSPTPVTMTNAAGHTISGSGGRIYSNVTVNNLGTIEANGGTVELQTAPTQFSGTTLTGGTWKAINGSLTVGGSPAVTTNQATVALSGSSSAFAPINSLADNQGSFSILGGRTFNTAGALTNSGTIEIDVSSKLAINGGYTQTAGMTSVDGTLSTTTGMVLSGGELAGTGTINGATTVEAGATLSPGHSAGVLTFQRLALNSGAIYNFEIDGPNADRIDIIGSGDVFTLASGGVFTINLDVLNPTGALSEYALFHWVGSTAIPADTTWLVTGAPGVSGVVEIRPDLNSIMLTNVTVPEPLSIGLFVAAAMGLLARRRSR